MDRPITENRTTAMAISDALRDAICAGEWASGAALRQADLALQFKTSRLPVRDALLSLQSEGLVVVEPNRGAFVAGMTPDRLGEIFDLRALLEVDALRHAIPNHTEQTLRHLEAIQRELDAVRSERGDWMRLDRMFHQILYAPSQREQTQRMIGSLRRMVERFYVAEMDPGTRRREWRDEHLALIEEVRAKRVKAACALLLLHLRQTQDAALAALATT